jgi:hypothetical protein
MARAREDAEEIEELMEWSEGWGRKRLGMSRRDKRLSDPRSATPL